MRDRLDSILNKCKLLREEKLENDEGHILCSPRNIEKVLLEMIEELAKEIVAM